VILRHPGRSSELGIRSVFAEAILPHCYKPPRWRSATSAGVNPRCLPRISSGVVLQGCGELPEWEQHFLLFVFDDSRGNRLLADRRREYIRESVNRVIPFAKPVRRLTDFALVCGNLSPERAQLWMRNYRENTGKSDAWLKSAFAYFCVCQSAKHVPWNVIRKVDFVLLSSKYSRCDVFRKAITLE